MNTSSNSNSNPWAIIKAWQHLPSHLVARLPEQVKAQMSQWNSMARRKKPKLVLMN
jgi:hypothetical protein